MKRRQLRERELANTAHLPSHQKAVRYDHILRSSGGSWSYSFLMPSFYSALGVRESFASVFDWQVPTLSELFDAGWRLSGMISIDKLAATRLTDRFSQAKLEIVPNGFTQHVQEHISCSLPSFPTICASLRAVVFDISIVELASLENDKRDRSDFE